MVLGWLIFSIVFYMDLNVCVVLFVQVFSVFMFFFRWWVWLLNFFVVVLFVVCNVLVLLLECCNWVIYVICFVVMLWNWCVIVVSFDVGFVVSFLKVLVILFIFMLDVEEKCVIFWLMDVIWVLLFIFVLISVLSDLLVWLNVSFVVCLVLDRISIWFVVSFVWLLERISVLLKLDRVELFWYQVYVSVLVVIVSEVVFIIGRVIVLVSFWNMGIILLKEFFIWFFCCSRISYGFCLFVSCVVMLVNCVGSICMVVLYCLMEIFVFCVVSVCWFIDCLMIVVVFFVLFFVLEKWCLILVICLLNLVVFRFKLMIRLFIGLVILDFFCDFFWYCY